jgi:hypothetical protein
MNIEQPGSYFRALRKPFFGLKYLKLFDAGPESGIEKIKIRYPGSGMPKIRIRDKHPGPATRRKNVKVCKFGVARIVATVQFSLSNFLGKMFE